MIESNITIEILGYIICLIGVLVGGYTLLERLFGISLFFVYWNAIPSFLQASYPDSPFTPWFAIRSQKNIHEAWDVALILIFFSSLSFILMAGFWILLLLYLIGIINIGINWLIFIFIILFFIYFVAACNQFALEIKAQHRRADKERIIRYMQQEPGRTIKRVLFHFLRNWIITPLICLQLLLILILLFLFDWLGWLTMFLPQRYRLNLSDDNVRRDYYIGYALFLVIIGLTLSFVF